jgi:predicted porin
MKKTIIAAAIAASVAAPAAFAEVTVYGKAHLDYTSGDSDTGMSSNASRFGINASEDLGNGMKSFAKVEIGYDAMDSVDGAAADNAQFFERDAYVGLSGDFGKVMAGRMGVATKGALYGLGNVQLADSIVDFADGFASKSSYSNYGRVSNAVAYANNFNGVNVVAGIAGGEGTDNMDHNTFGIDTTIGGVKVGAARTDIDGQGDATVYGAKMSMDALTVAVLREDVSVDGGNDYDTTGISTSYAMGANVVAVSYSTRDTDNTANDTDRTNVSLEHKLSKKTSLYVAYGEVDNGTTTTDNTAVGMIVNF